MATPLGNCFSTTENQVLQCDVGSTVETLVIHHDQERFEQLLSGGSASALCARKHRKVSVARASLATSWKQVSVKTTKVPCEPITTSLKAKQALREPIIVSAETNPASRQCDNIVRENA